MGCLHDDELPTFFLFFFIASDSYGIPKASFFDVAQKRNLYYSNSVFPRGMSMRSGVFLNDDGDIKLMGMNEFRTCLDVSSHCMLGCLWL